MITKTISNVTLDIKRNNNCENKTIELVISINKLLNKVDFSANIIPIEDIENLTNLLTILKCEKLSNCESTLVEDVIGSLTWIHDI